MTDRSQDRLCSRLLSQGDLLQLLDDYQAPCISLFMPTHLSGPERRQDEIRLRNLLRLAEQELGRRRTDVQKIDYLLSAIERLPHALNGWQLRSTGLAVFCAADYFRCFSLPLKLDEQVVVDDRFHVAPLMPLLHANGRYFILALSKDSADLYEASRYSLVERELPALWSNRNNDERPPLQYHSHQSPATAPAGANQAMYHGQGGIADREQIEIESFFRRQVDLGVSHTLRDQRAPLVLACVDELVSLYRDINTYPYLYEKTVSGSPSQMATAELHQRAWNIVAPAFRDVEIKARHKYESLAGSSRTQTTSAPILAAARRGQVDTLFLPMQLPESDDAPTATFEEAAEQTLLFGGQVIAVEEVPGDSSLAAVFRY